MPTVALSMPPPLPTLILTLTLTLTLTPPVGAPSYQHPCLPHGPVCVEV